uniref:Uncharacterized protein n=1 Tax=Siphoviridae sp. ctmHK36 TaxID=2827931 RepID=A0A8S5TBQ9_9CAUD|nr:MAG TPA: hypothetical protein [Siphoviridae sp. ctmHK36]
MHRKQKRLSKGNSLHNLAKVNLITRISLQGRG